VRVVCESVCVRVVCETGAWNRHLPTLVIFVLDPLRQFFLLDHLQHLVSSHQHPPYQREREREKE